MSLHHVANHIKAQGRGPDDQLIHMSSNEIAGLQALAMAHGGSLTINPQTGLPEAGFLDSLLPTIIGAGAVFLSGGTITPLMAGLGVGGIEAARTGDLGKGLMAGLGAYGGGGMLEGLAGAGANELASSGLSSVNGMDLASDQALKAGPSMADKLTAGAKAFASDPSVSALGGIKTLAMGAAPAILGALSPQKEQAPQGTPQMIRPYTFEYNKQNPTNPVGGTYQPGQDTSERQWFQPQYTALTPYAAPQANMYAGGGPIEQMSNENAVGANTGYPQADITGHAYATPWQTPVSQNVVQGSSDAGVNRMTGEQTFSYGGLSSLAKSAAGEDVMPMEQEEKMAIGGGISSLGSYSDGGHLLKGPGDGMSDNIPAKIGSKQPARLADGEFVVPADVVSHLGNGSTDAGAKQLYKMMDKIRTARTGRKAQGKQINPNKFMPA